MDGKGTRSRAPLQGRDADFKGGTRLEAEGGLDRSLLNMVHFYRASLHALLRGETSLGSVPIGNRKRFTESGIVRRFGSRYQLTETGSELLQHQLT